MTQKSLANGEDVAVLRAGIPSAHAETSTISMQPGSVLPAGSSADLSGGRDKLMPDKVETGLGKQVIAEIVLSSLRWKSAKTYPDAPHEYVTVWQYPKVFPIIRELIKAKGIREQFTLRGKTQTYKYYYPGDGYRYWVMGTILNRTKTGENCD